MTPMLGLMKSLIRSNGSIAPLPLWTPSQISTALWLDANDASTVVLNGSTVSQWSDKSGNGRHASQITTTSQPTYSLTGFNGKSSIGFDGIDDSLSLSTNLTFSNEHSIFVVVDNKFLITESTSPQLILSGGAYVSPTTSEFFFGVGGLTANLTNERLYSTVLADGNVFGNGKTNSNIPTGGFFISSAFTANNNFFVGRFNGSNDFLIPCQPGSFSTTNTRNPSVVRAIGRRFTSPANYWNGKILEIVIFQTFISSTITEKIEGYFAWKWGLVANLPSGHPYKNSPPIV